MDQKVFSCRFKFNEETRTFEGWLATYGNVDQGGDSIQRGAFTKTLESNRGEVPLLWHHDGSRPLGKATLTDSKKGLKITGRLLEGVQAADEAYRFLKAGVVRGLSIGYDTVKAQMVGGVRHLLEVKLFEASLVTLPMNERAVVTAVKDAEGIPAELAAEVEGLLQDCRRRYPG